MSSLLPIVHSSSSALESSSVLYFSDQRVIFPFFLVVVFVCREMLRRVDIVAVTFISTIVCSTVLSWDTLPHFPVFISYTGHHGYGYWMLAGGLCLCGIQMFMIHGNEPDYFRRTLARIGAICLALTGIINGDHTLKIVMAHSIISNACFITYFLYLYLSNWKSQWLYVGVTALVAGQLLGITYVVVTEPSALLNKPLYRATLDLSPLILRQCRAVAQWIMISSLFTCIYSYSSSISSSHRSH
jgi:hypothetical protein